MDIISFYTDVHFQQATIFVCLVLKFWLGYMKEKRVRNDRVFYTCGQSLGNASGYVIKNDPFKKEMVVSSNEVLIEKGKLLDEQIEEEEVRTISYFELQPEHVRSETGERMRKAASLSDHQPDDDTEDCYIFQAPQKSSFSDLNLRLKFNIDL